MMPAAVAGQVLALTPIGGFLLTTLIFGGAVTGDVVLSIVLIVAGIVLTLRAHSIAAGKNFHATGGFGPWIVTADEIPDPTRLHLMTRLNGREVQHTGIDDLIFDIPTLISYCSDWTPLVAGDVISTGTPEGVGFARKPPLWMKPGDVVEVEIDGGVGVLRNPIIAEA